MSPPLPPTGLDPATLARAAELVRAADGVLVTAGAGMGVDSGLPDFRGRQGFWRAYPALGRLGLDFTEVASPDTFARDPRLAWGFYGHRLTLYRTTRPHEGFGLLVGLGARMPRGAFVFTSNVDGQFQRAGFPDDRLCEVHGSIHHLQCTGPCGPAIWPADGLAPEVDEAACRLVSALPRCPRCGALARPNILMFGDPAWIEARSAAQEERLAAWLSGVDRPVVIEIGAGVHVPTVRRFGERFPGRLVRINPTDPDIPGGAGVSLAAPGLAGLRALAAALGQEQLP